MEPFEKYAVLGFEDVTKANDLVQKRSVVIDGQKFFVKEFSDRGKRPSKIQECWNFTASNPTYIDITSVSDPFSYELLDIDS